MPHQIFTQMSDAELLELYPDWESWNKTGFIPANSKFEEIRDNYMSNTKSTFPYILNFDYTAECTRRFYQSNRKEQTT